MITAGIDVGSATTKAVVLKDGNVASWTVARSGADGRRRAEETLLKALEPVGVGIGDISYIVATGYGRINVPFAHKTLTEITCHAKGARAMFPKTRLIIDMGGQDSKAIRLDEHGYVMDFVMNDKCAAGTGRFLEVMAGVLEVGLEEMGELSLTAGDKADISSTCTVFAESEVISLIAAGRPKAEILRGLHESIADRMAGMARRLGVQPEVTMTGGVCYNAGVRKALEDRLRLRVNMPDNPQITGAYGAALIAAGQAGAAI